MNKLSAELYKSSIVKIGLETPPLMSILDEIEVTFEDKPVTIEKGKTSKGYTQYAVKFDRLPPDVKGKMRKIKQAQDTFKNISKVELMLHGCGELEWVFDQEVSIWDNGETYQVYYISVDTNEPVSGNQHKSIKTAVFEAIISLQKIALDVYYDGHWDHRTFDNPNPLFAKGGNA